jgi:nitroreductase
MDSTNGNKFDINQINLLIHTRRSVYTNQFISGKVIPEEIIRQLLENANWAPTHKNTEPWRFVIFSGDGLKRLAEFQAALYKKNSGQRYKEEKFEKLLKTPSECSHVIALCMKRSLDVNIPEIEEIAAVACAVQNLYLSTCAYGLGGYWSTGGVTYDEEAKPFFNLGEMDKLMGFFYLGFVRLPSPKGLRRPIEDKIVWVNQ